MAGQSGATASDTVSPIGVIEAGLDALDWGVGIFDAGCRLVFFNRLYRTIPSYPANLCQPGTHLKDLLQHDLAHGQLALEGAGDPVAGWLTRAASGLRHSEEIEFEDGRHIVLTVAPTVDGGHVVSLSDQTEQRREDKRRRATQEWYDLVTEATTEGLYDWDVVTGDLKVTFRLTAMLGIAPGDLTATDWNERLHPDEIDAYRAAIAAHFRGETASIHCEYRIRRKSGDYIWVADSGKCVRDDTGRAIRLVGAISNITPRKLAELSLQRGEERYALAMRAINEGVYDWDIEKDTIFYSESVRDALGLAPEQLRTADDWFNRIHEEDAPLWRQAVIAHFKGETDRFESEFRYRGAGGEWRWARQHGIAQFNEDGRAVRMIGATGDITELHEQREAAEEARAHLAIAIESISEGFAIYDAEDRLVLCNDEYRAIYPGIDDIMVPGVTFETVLRACFERGIFADLGDDPEAALAERLRLHQEPGPPFDARLSDGRWTRVAWQRTRRGGIVGVFTDITALKEIEVQVRQSEERYALAAEAATEGLYDWDVVQDRLHVSDRLNAIISLPTLTLTSGEWKNRVHPRDQKAYGEAMLAHFQGETHYLATEYRIRDGQGQYIWISDNATSVRNDVGRVVRLVGAISDVTARKKADQELQEAKRRAEDASLLAMEKAQALELLSNKLSKYLSPQVYSSIFAGERDVEIDARRKKLTVFFSDIAGFTTIVDSLESEELTGLLNEYLTEMSRIALDHGATIDKFIGDAILAFFGDPETKGYREDALACVRMAIAMQRRLRELQAGWRDLGLEQIFELRIGITTGFCTVGNFGSEDRMDYTVVGNEVNLAARLQAHAESGGILLSGETWGLVKDEIHAEDIGKLEIRGISRPMQAYRVIGIYDEMVGSGDLLKIDQPGLRLMLHQSQLGEDDRKAALLALQAAMSSLSGDGA